MANNEAGMKRQLDRMKPGSWPRFDSDKFATTAFKSVRSYTHICKYKVNVAEMDLKTSRIVTYITAVQMYRLLQCDDVDVQRQQDEWLCFYLIPFMLLGKVPIDEKRSRLGLPTKELDNRLKMLAQDGWKPLIQHRRRVEKRRRTGVRGEIGSPKEFLRN